MAITATLLRGPVPVGVGEHYIDVTLAWDASYAVGGEAFPTTVTNHFKTAIRRVSFETPTLAEGGYVYKLDGTLASDGSGFTPATAVLAIFRADYDAVADGPLTEVPNETDISALGDHIVRIYGV